MGRVGGLSPRDTVTFVRTGLRADVVSPPPPSPAPLQFETIRKASAVTPAGMNDDKQGNFRAANAVNVDDDGESEGEFDDSGMSDVDDTAFSDPSQDDTGFSDPSFT